MDKTAQSSDSPAVLTCRLPDGTELSRLGMGAMRLPQTAPGLAGPIDEPRATELVDYCMQHGVNYYDTAYIYHGGASEVVLGRALARHPRESYHVADKFNVQANSDYRAQLAQQLERLGTGHIDFYLLHGVTDRLVSDYLDNGAPEYFEEQRRRGTLRRLGFSFHGSPEALRAMLDRRKWDFVQIQLNYYDWLFGTAREQYEILRERSVPVMVMEPVHGGMRGLRIVHAALPAGNRRARDHGRDGEPCRGAGLGARRLTRRRRAASTSRPPLPPRAARQRARS